MVEEVQAYRDSAGQLHSARLDAARADAKLVLEKILGNRDGSAPFIVIVLERAEEIVEALTPYVEEDHRIGMAQAADDYIKPPTAAELADIEARATRDLTEREPPAEEVCHD